MALAINILIAITGLFMVLFAILWTYLRWRKIYKNEVESWHKTLIQIGFLILLILFTITFILYSQNK